MNTKNKIAVLVALNNYPGTMNDLKGCINDSKGWLKRLQSRFNFTDIITLWDSKATVSAVKEACLSQFAKCKENDSFAFINSCHGTWVPDSDGDEADGKDEAICMYDGLISDDFFRELFKNPPPGLNLTMVSDSCHSGTMTKQAMFNPSQHGLYSKPKFMQPPKKYLDMEKKLRQGSRMYDAARAQSIMNEVLITGCKDNQYSADAYIDGTYYGALSYYCFKVIDSNEAPITYNDFYTQLRRHLPSSEYDQIPQLECSAENRNKFIFG